MSDVTTATATAPGSGSSAVGASSPARSGGMQLITEQGRTSIADSVVEKIAGMATRQVPGVHAMGSGASRAFGAIREKLPVGGGSPSPAQGVSVEVGERQAAVDLRIIVEYGESIVDLSQAIRRNVISQVQNMTGLEVTEVNISVDDVYLGETGDDQQPRVQ